MIKPHNTNTEFELGGINHVALVCADMQRTKDFYSGVLGMPLIKSLDLPGGMGQHFFFDAGNGDCVAFFWFATAPDGVPGISAPAAIPGIGEIVSAVGSMNHLAFHVPEDKFDAYRQRLKDKGVRVGPVLNHDARRDHPRICLLDQRIHRPGRRDGAPHRRRPACAGGRGLTEIQRRVGEPVEN